MTENDCAAAPRNSKTAMAMSYICNRIKEANSLRRKPAIFSTESKALRFDCEHRLRLGKVQVHLTLLSACTVLVADFETHHAE